MIKAIFLDFDGTVSDAHDIAYESLMKTLDDFGLKYNKKKAYDLLGNKMHIILDKLGIEIKNLQKFRKRYYRYFTKAAIDGGIKPCVSLKPLWELSKEYPLIVISNSETSFLKASIKKLGIEGMFNKIYGAEKFTKKDKLLKKLFKKMKIKPNEAIYIGDRFSDVNYAKEAGCISIAMYNKCSWSNLKAIKKENPNYIIKDFRELKKSIKELNSP